MHVTISPISVCPITRKELSAVIGIAEQQLGHAYLDSDVLLATGSLASCAAIDDKVVGFYIAKVVSVDEVYQRIRGLREKGLTYLEDAEKVGMVSSVATHPGYAGKGIASTLVRHCVAALERQAVNVIAAIAWKSDKGVHIGAVLAKQGFEEVMQLDDFWKEDSVSRHYTCPACGDPPCRCKAVIYIRHRH